MKPFDPARTREVRRRTPAPAADPAAGEPGPGVAVAQKPVAQKPAPARPARTSATRHTPAGPAPAGKASTSSSPDSQSPASTSSATKATIAKPPRSASPTSDGPTAAAAPPGSGRGVAAGKALGRGKGPGLSRRSALGMAGEPRRSKADEAYLAIRNAIMDGSLAPGTALDKPAICRDLRLSRFPVTAAIARLAFEHLVDVEPQRGSFVSRIAARDARELMLVRRGIEVEIAGEAARLFDDEAVAALKRILRYQQAALAAGDFQDFHRLDHALHDQIIADLGFGRAGEILEGIRLRVERARRILLPVPGRMGRTFQEHTAIVDAIANRDAPAARSAMREHLQRVLDEFDVLARERPDLFAP